MGYEELLIEADQQNIIVREKRLINNDGRIRGRRIAIRQDIPTLAKKADVLAEELGHYHTSVGRIVEQDSINSRKQERIARLWAYNKRVGLVGLIEAFKHGCQNRFEIAEFLDVSEDTLADALEYYRQIYGISTQIDNYRIQFEPYLAIMELYS